MALAGSTRANTVQARRSISANTRTRDSNVIPLPGLNSKQWETLLQMLKNGSGSIVKMNGKYIWIINSGASHHMTSMIEELFNLKDIVQCPVELTTDGYIVMAKKKGDVRFDNGFILKNVLYVPGLTCNLLSVPQFLDEGNCIVQFAPNIRVIHDFTSRTVIGACERRDGGLFYFREVPTTQVFKTTTTTSIPFDLWHKRLEPIVPSVNENEYNDNGLHEESPSQDRGNELVNEETTVHDNQTVRDDDTLSSPQSLNVEEQIQEENLGRGHRKKETSVRLRDYVTNTVKKNSPSRSTPPAQSRSSDTPYPIAHYVNCDKFAYCHRAFLEAIEKEREPVTYYEAIKDKRWRSEMDSKLEALEQNKTWMIEKLSPNKKALRCKSVYKIKYKSDGTIERFKARLVILGNHQVAGVDYSETFTQVAKMVTVRVFLAITAAKQWELHQMDVHNTSLHGDLEEEVFMKLPPCLHKGQPKEACKLRRSLYGLRQAPRCWFSKLSSALKKYGFVQSYSDYSLFTLQQNGVQFNVLVYVDDLIVYGNDHEAITQFKTYLMINDLKKCGYSKDNCELNFKFLNNLQPEWKPYATMMRQNQNLMDINIDALYNILKQNQGDVNDAMGLKKKTVVVTSDLLALIVEKTKVSKRKKKVVVSSDSKGSDADVFSELKNITALLTKAFNRRKFYSKPTNNNFRTSSTSQSANKKQEFVKMDNKKLEKKDDEKKRDMSKIKSQIEKVLSDSETSSLSADDTISEVSYYLSESESESEYETSEYYDNTTTNGLFVNDNDDQEIFHDCENFHENLIESQIDHNESAIDHNDSKGIDKLIRKINKKIAKCLKPTFEINNKELNEQLKVLIEKNDDLLAQTNVLKDQLLDKHVVIDTHVECQERYAKLEAERYEYTIRYSGYFDNDKQHRKQIADQEVLYDKMSVQLVELDKHQTSSLKPYVPTVILEKIIIDLEDEVVSLLEKEKTNLETIESLKSKGFESSENAISELKNQSENDCQVVKKECDQVGNSKVIVPGMFKLNKWSSNTSNVNLSSVSNSKLNKDVKRYSRKDLLSCNNSRLRETSSAYVCNDAMNVSCNSRFCDSFDENNLFIFDDKSIKISPYSKIPFRKKPRDSLNVRSSIVQICLWIIDSGCSKHMTGNHALLTNFVEKFLGTVRFGNNDFAGLEVAFQNSTCFVRNEDGVDLLTDMKAAVLYAYETFKAIEGELLLDTYIRYLQVINDLKRYGYSKDNCELNFKFLNNLQPEWKQHVSRSKEKVAVSSDSEGSKVDDFSELKKITALLAKAFNRRKFYSKPTNNNLRTSSTSQSANKKQEFVKSDDKQVVKKADKKKQDVSIVTCYNCKKEGHFAKDCKKAKVKDYEYYK
nr:retrovirus-related Pol polyprotein from transposon TNT 1-94 [Tanacetum cinerariifolium]